MSRLFNFAFEPRDFGTEVSIFESVNLVLEIRMWRHDAPASPDQLGRSIGPLLNLAKPGARIANPISIEQIDFGTAKLAAFVEMKFSRAELQDRATIRRVSRGQRRE
jgi:hypothetical protein